jgi:lipopolysaccharide transport system ATP-binding protein
MSNTAIKVENLSKVYRLGEIGTGSIGQDVDRWFKTKILGKEDPFLKIGESNDRSKKGTSDIVYSLQDINFEIQQGDAVGIIGRNGAGKSTLLKILSRVTTPTTGRINIKGRVASLLEVGTGFHPELTGRENIYLNGAILGMRKREIDRKLDEIIDFSGVERYIDTPVKRYSSGMYVRLAFAVAAHLESEILIVDEVLAVGDAEFQKKCLGKLKDVRVNDGRTVLFVSHDMQSISTLTEKAILLRHGLITGYDETNKIIEKYAIQSKTSDIAYTSKRDKSKPHISSVELLTTYSNNIQRNGESLKVKITLFTPYPVKNACFAFHFVNKNEINQTHCWVFDSEKPFCRNVGFTTLICEIPSLKLYMGKYTIKCFFSEPPGGEVFEILEWICPFEVTMFNISRDQFQWHPNACTYIEDYNWTIQ